jgi:hypothetical protein
MAADRGPGSGDSAGLVARVSEAKRDVLLRVHRHRLGFEDLEDCFGRATLELVVRARARERSSARRTSPTRSSSVSASAISRSSSMLRSRRACRGASR